MKKNYMLVLVFVLSLVTLQAQNVEGTWRVASQAGALGVGPTQGDISWWSNSDGDVTTRACFFDDEYIFDANGTFSNVLGADTWLETWQGVMSDGCGAPVAPHDGSASATWSYDAMANTLTVTGTGAYLGLPKVHNNGELTDPNNAVASITYQVTSITDTTMTLDINYNPGADGWWRFEMKKDMTSSTNVVANETTFKVFPNPASDQFTISFEESFSSNAMLNVFDLQGQLVYQQILTDQQTVVPTAELNTGLYIIRVDDEGKSYTQKLSVMK